MLRNFSLCSWAGYRSIKWHSGIEEVSSHCPADLSYSTLTFLLPWAALNALSSKFWLGNRSLRQRFCYKPNTWHFQCQWPQTQPNPFAQGIFSHWAMLCSKAASVWIQRQPRCTSWTSLGQLSSPLARPSLFVQEIFSHWSNLCSKAASMWIQRQPHHTSWTHPGQHSSPFVQPHLLSTPAAEVETALAGVPAGRRGAGRGWGSRAAHEHCKLGHEGTRFPLPLRDKCRHMPAAAVTIWCKTTGFVPALWENTVWGEHRESSRVVSVTGGEEYPHCWWRRVEAERSMVKHIIRQKNPLNHP